MVAVGFCDGVVFGLCKMFLLTAYFQFLLLSWKMRFSGKTRWRMWQSPDGEWLEWFWVVKIRIKVFEKFFGVEYNSLKPLKQLKPLTTIEKHR